MDLLKRNLAPISPEAWALIDGEVGRVLKQHLAGRKLIDVTNPRGWEYAAVNTGRLALLDEQPVTGVHVGLRQVMPLVELRAPMLLPVMELDLATRGSELLDLDVLVKTAEQVAHMEDTAIFDGYNTASIKGIVPSSTQEPVTVPDVFDWPACILKAMAQLRKAGITPPYALALGSTAYDELFAAMHDGYPVANQIKRFILDGPIVRAAALTGGVLMSVRGGDYELVLGQDLSIGYAFHDKQVVELYLTESFTFRVLEPAAAVQMVRASA